MLLPTDKAKLYSYAKQGGGKQRSLKKSPTTTISIKLQGETLISIKISTDGPVRNEILERTTRHSVQRKV